MKKSTKILTLIAAASISYFTLYAIVGPRHFRHCHRACCQQESEKGPVDHSKCTETKDANTSKESL